MTRTKAPPTVPNLPSNDENTRFDGTFYTVQVGQPLEPTLDSV
jgi:hypothetical protein